MKVAVWGLVALLMVGTGLVFGKAEAKSVKWSCVQIDPMNPSTYYCTPILRP